MLLWGFHQDGWLRERNLVLTLETFFFLKFSNHWNIYFWMGETLFMYAVLHLIIKASSLWIIRSAAWVYFSFILFTWWFSIFFPAQLTLIFSHRHIDSVKSVGKNSSLTEDGSVNIYPIMLRVSVTQDNALTVKVGKKVRCLHSAIFF